MILSLLKDIWKVSVSRRLTVNRKKTGTFRAFFILFLLLNCIYIKAVNVFMDDYFSEESLFSGDMFIEKEDVVMEEVDVELRKDALDISGNLTNIITYTQKNTEKNLLNFDEIPDNYFNVTSLANIFFDARFRNRVKVFLDLELFYDYNGASDEGLTDGIINEAFIDIPILNKIYIKAGKQVLQWGTTYFWNPTDLINLELRDIRESDIGKEGIKGIKVHLPYGVKRNLYFFLNTTGIDSLDDLAISAKYEFLVDNTEIALSAWNKKNSISVYGLDISTRFRGVDIKAELSLSQGDNNYIMDYDTLEVYKEEEDWITRMSVGFTRSFDYENIPDRISITGELYYNSNGYDKNIYKRIDEITDPLEKLITLEKFLKDVYLPNMNSRYYAGFFINFIDLLISDLILNLNGVVNLVDFSKIISIGINYQVKDNINLELNITNFIGDKNTEAVLFGNDYTVTFSTSYSF